MMPPAKTQPRKADRVFARLMEMNVDYEQAPFEVGASGSTAKRLVAKTRMGIVAAAERDVTKLVRLDLIDEIAEVFKQYEASPEIMDLLSLMRREIK